LKKYLETHPDNFEARMDLMLVYIGAGKYHEALAEYETAKSKDKTAEDPIMAGVIYGLMGNRKAAEQQIVLAQRYAGKYYISPAGIALIYAALGDKDPAFAWLEKGYQTHAWWMVFLKIDARFDKLRSDPRFADLLRRVGFAQ
jgi:tetratricopeptide (TPR) repeat protein